MDVRMLGSGRPFVLEVANARAAMPPQECFDQMAASLNSSGVGVEVRKLQPVDKDILKLIKVCLVHYTHTLTKYMLYVHFCVLIAAYPSP